MAETNPNSRLETFCDGVFAIALTLLIIDIKIPSTEPINNTQDFWIAFKQIIPSVSAFVLSFAIIFITWVNHHNFFKLVNKSSASFIYSNGLILLAVVIIPFPTSLMGEYILTDHAAPSVILYNAVVVIQSIGWILVCNAALKNKLTKNETSNSQMKINRRNAYFSVVVYSLLAVIAIWFPLAIAIVTALLWIFWLIFGLRFKSEEKN